ncbi:hypothetical protein ACVMFA_008737 [Bradyrhizobium liaoningense]
MQAVVALVRLEAAFGDVHADDRFRGNAERLHALEVGRHVGLADQHVAHADLLEVIAERGLANAQRPAVPMRAVRAHVAPGVERHPRGPTDRRLHIGVGEQHAALCHGVDVRCLQRGMAGAAEIIIAKLVAHDPENVLRARHASSLLFLDRSMLRYRGRDDKPVPNLTTVTTTEPHPEEPAASGRLEGWLRARAGPSWFETRVPRSSP